MSSLECVVCSREEDSFIVVGVCLCGSGSETFLVMTGEYGFIRIVSLPANMDFMIFNHRGKAFPIEMDLKLKS
ncbi:hypothetical protein GIB67_002959 [Kingdonia uniflora]|uniref:Uncharacterized protein n=1 Tax=Kingdonia uniflora TaxID=39325 RepID=A0A7J7M8Z2_9MAGN|nr:hypothetical protein GIB67_002959 [Kingdonia uniflora]